MNFLAHLYLSGDDTPVMLGHLDIVKQVLSSNPQLLNSKGPHGFTMLHHAMKGGEASKPVVDYLQALGAKETKIDFYLKA